ncbi:hypothetical protein Tco_0979726, partial [Tanacetum coccineum]
MVPLVSAWSSSFYRDRDNFGLLGFWAVLLVSVERPSSNPSPWFVLVFISPLKGFSGLSELARGRDIGVGLSGE